MWVLSLRPLQRGDETSGAARRKGVRGRERMRGDTAAAAAAGNGAPKPENLLSEKQWPGTWSNYHAGETPGSRLRDASSSPLLIPTRRGEPRPRVAFTTPSPRLRVPDPERFSRWDTPSELTGNYDSRDRSSLPMSTGLPSPSTV